MTTARGGAAGERVRFGSLFSGVGGMDAGLERAGMECEWQVEIEKHPRAVLRYRWPNTPIHEDVHDVGTANLEPVSLLCAGFPCQDYSVAGTRGGLAGDRGALWWEMHRIIAELRPAWVLGENVPGLLSSNGGADFLTIVDSLVQLGYGVCWGVLDSQYFGVPQRRRRLFVVGHSGGVARPEVLALAEGMCGHPAPRRETREDVAGSPGGGAGVTGFYVKGDGSDGSVIAPTMRGLPNQGPASMGVTHTLTGEGHDASEDGTGRGTPLVAHALPTKYRGDPHEGTDTIVIKGAAIGRKPENGPQRGEFSHDSSFTLNATEVHAVIPFDTTQMTSAANRSHPIAAGAHPPTIAFTAEAVDRDGTHEDGTHEDGTHHPLRVKGRAAVAMGFDPGQSANPKATHQMTVDGMPPLGATTASRHAVAFGSKDHGPLQPTVLGGVSNATTGGCDDAAKTRPREVLRELREAFGEEAVAVWQAGILASFLPSKILRPDLYGRWIHGSQAHAGPSMDDSTLPRAQGQATRTMRAVWEAGCQRCAPQGWRLEKQLAAQLGAYLSGLSHTPPSTEAVVLCQELRETPQGARILRQALSTLEEVGFATRVQGEPAHPPATPRRLTPLETERLQGWPDDWTRYGVDDDGNSYELSDSARYRACGNGVTATVAQWIGERIMAASGARE